MSSSEQYTGPSAVSQLIVGLFLLGLTVVLWLNADSLPSAQAVGIGPAAALNLTAILLLILSIFHFINALNIKQRAHSITKNDKTKVDHASLAWGVSGMVLMIIIIALNGGFIIASTVLFSFIARAFGKRIGPKSILIGLVLSIIASFFFTKLIMLTLPFGPIESLMFGEL